MIDTIACRIAVLMVSYNRREKTLAAIEDLYEQNNARDVEYKIFLVDAGSVDGTVEAVALKFPSVQLIRTSNDVYWTRGTALAMEAAMAEGFPYFLLLNDDTRLCLDAISRLFDTYTKVNPTGHQPSIVVGALRDPDTRVTTYGGQLRHSSPFRLEFTIVDPDETDPIRVDTMNGNVVLIDSLVTALIGNLDRKFNHQRGDIDFGLRATSQGVGIWVAPGYVGMCSRNQDFHVWKDGNLGIVDRWRRIVGPKQFPPRETLRYCRRHGGPFWFVTWLRPYVSGIKWTIIRLFEAMARAFRLH